MHYEAPEGWSAPPPARAVSTAEVTLAPVHAQHRESLIRLREMHPYGTDAPSIGQLPQPYLEPQLAFVQVRYLHAVG